MSQFSKVLLCLAAVLVDSKDTCLGDTGCCEPKGKISTPGKCNATASCRWSNGGNGTSDMPGCWYRGDRCDNCSPANTSRSACSGSPYCSEHCLTSIPHLSRLPTLPEKPRCVENFPAAEMQNGACLTQECCGGTDGNSGGLAAEETPDVCMNTEYCQWYDGSQPDEHGVRGCIYQGPQCVLCGLPAKARDGSVVGQPCETGKYETNSTFCKTRCATARNGFMGSMVCRNARASVEEVVV